MDSNTSRRERREGFFSRSCSMAALFIGTKSRAVNFTSKQALNLRVTYKAQKPAGDRHPVARAGFWERLFGAEKLADGHHRGRFGAGFLGENGREVALAGGGGDGHDALAGELGAFGEFEGGPDVAAG